MDKKSFLNIFSAEDEFLISSLWEDITLCIEIDYPIYSSVFLSPQIWSKLHINSHALGVNIFSAGLNSNSEKRVVAFAPLNLTEDSLDFPVVFFKIIGTNKFKTLQHKDFLGAIMNLGLKRESLGDILVKDNIAYCISFENIFEIIKNNLKQINIVPIKISIIEDKEEIPQIIFKDLHLTLTSLRLDSLISSICNISRSSSTTLIENGDVLIDYCTEKNKTKLITLGTTITIKHYGKYLFSQILGENKKGKIKILIKQYV